MRAAPGKELSLFDSVCIIVGIIVGAGIYKTAPQVAASMGGWIGALGIWLVGGLLALAGALTYAELATAYPDEGGDYVYLTRAYGRWAGYLFGWSQLAVVRPADIAMMAYIFATYAGTIYAPFADYTRPAYAAGAVVVLTVINVLGVREGKWTQNLLTVLKVLCLLAIVAAGMFAPRGGQVFQQSGVGLGGFELALILVLFTFGGWNEMAYVAAEVKNPRRNIVRGLVLGTVLVTVLYLVVNGAYLWALGYPGLAGSDAVAIDTVATVFPDAAERAIGVVICISVLGAANGLILTGARISYALGREHRAFRPLGRWSGRFGTPVWALIVQGGLSVAIVLIAGSFIDTVIYSAPVVWVFFLGTALSVFVLRHRESATERPYRVGGYPVTPLVFVACCGFMLYSCYSYAYNNKPLGLSILAGVMIAGAVLYLLTDGFSRRRVA